MKLLEFTKKIVGLIITNNIENCYSKLVKEVLINRFHY